jgi:hypothetical protein
MIDKSGVYQISSEEYHADPCPVPSLSSGIAKIMLDQSPRHAWAAHPRLNPAYKAENSQQFDLGKAAHSLILDDPQRFVYVEADSYRTKAAQLERDAAYQAGHIPLLPSQALAVEGMQRAFHSDLSRHTELQEAWGYGSSEQTWIDCDEGTWFRIRPDRVSEQMHIIIDYKTIANAAPESCVRQIFAMGWDVQNGFYRRTANFLKDAWEVPYRFVFLFQETEPPYCLTAVELAPDAQAYADHRAAKAVALWRQCMAEQSWPGYPAETCFANLPTWTAKRWESEQIREP